MRFDSAQLKEIMADFTPITNAITDLANEVAAVGTEISRLVAVIQANPDDAAAVAKAASDIESQVSALKTQVSGSQTSVPPPASPPPVNP